MNISQSLYAICRRNAGVLALLQDGAPTSPPNIRLYPAGNIPQSDTVADTLMPAATYQTVGGAPANVFETAAPADNERLQIDCWSESYDQAQSVADAIRAAVEDPNAQTSYGVGIQIVSFNGHDYESDTKRYRVSFDLSIWQSR